MKPALAVRFGVACAAFGGILFGCSKGLTDGELGTARLVGFVRGAPPSLAIAPAVDRAGNVYVMGGVRSLPEVTVSVVRAGGGVSTGCRITKGDGIGPIGWVGFSETKQWYWSGGALVGVAASGDCRRVLDRDPTTGSDLSFKAVFPRVYDRPSRTTLVALAQGATDPLPTTVVVDLEAQVYTTPRAFAPATARDVVVHGTGASSSQRVGVAVLSFKDGETVRVEGRFYDEEGALVSAVGLPMAPPPPYGIAGFLQVNASGLAAGLTNDGKLVLFDRDGGRVADATGMKPVGVHLWEGSLYLVGTDADRPVIAPILDSGALGAVVPWVSSQRIQAALSRPLELTDDRAPPRRGARFDAPRSASGLFPLVTPHSSARYADGSTVIAIAGPTLGEGPGAFTLVAVAPVGVDYP